MSGFEAFKLIKAFVSAGKYIFTAFLRDKELAISDSYVCLSELYSEREASRGVR